MKRIFDGVAQIAERWFASELSAFVETKRQDGWAFEAVLINFYETGHTYNFHRQYDNIFYPELLFSDLRSKMHCEQIHHALQGPVKPL